MIKFEKKQVKLISVAIALVFVFSIVAIAVSQTGSMGIASAASSSNVGIVDYRQVMSQHPDLAAANTEMQKEIDSAKTDFESKSAGMNDQEKAAYYQQTQQRLQNKEKELIEPIRTKIEEAIKSIADAKGLSVVLDKSNVVYGGQDITADVVKKITK
ncbi:OmpH family outer membrane protein [Propionispira raffinosivorans]|jgi:outer membrane protein|uniref:OmpH family outer membrane protein n=1 Tax=Propionispira raffinosivorans TaxID=86959 RepID=UPI00036F8856|nr:OmpH family outer membrane protein [Propionispira raffinosivorans]